MSEYEAKKFNVGDEVIVTKPHYDSKDYKKGRVYKIERITTNADREECYELAGSYHVWYDDELEIAELKVGDIVELNLECPLKSIFRSNGLYSFSGTKSMLYGTLPVSANKEYKVVVVCTNPEKDIGLILEGVNDDAEFGYLDAALFTLVRRPEKVKEVTMAEVEERFGCKIKIIKENE